MRNRTVLLTILASCISTSVYADVISDWNEKAVSIVTARQLPPPQAERIMAMVHVAMFDAVNTIERRYRPYLVQFSQRAEAFDGGGCGRCGGRHHGRSLSAGCR